MQNVDNFNEGKFKVPWLPTLNYSYLPSIIFMDYYYFLKEPEPCYVCNLCIKQQSPFLLTIL